jgi:hypothetical protein
MHAPPLELRSDGPYSLFGLIERLRRSDVAELAVRTVLEPRKGENCVQLLTARFEFAAFPNEPRWDQKRYDIVNLVFGTTVPALTV